MSYMDRDNILEEGFLDKLGQKIKKLTVKGVAKLNPKYRRDYKKGLEQMLDWIKLSKIYKNV